MAKRGVYKNCVCCNKIFYAYPYQINDRKYCSTECMHKTTGPKISKTKIGKGQPLSEKSPKQWRHNYAYIAWREEVLKRDKFECVECGKTNLKSLTVHHIKSYQEFPELRIEVSNGITLCRSCHNKHDHGIKASQYKNGHK